MAGTVAFIDKGGTGTTLWVSSANPLPVAGTFGPTPASTAAVTDPTVTTASAQLIAANFGRLDLKFFNAGANPVYLLFGAGTASAVNCTVPLVAGAYYNVEGLFTGAVQAVAVGGSSVVCVTELTA